jgi:hypothetical protein
MDKDKEIEVVANIMTYRYAGIIQQIEYQRLQEICKYFDIPLTKENYPYCLSVKATLDGFLTMMYSLADMDETIRDPDGIAYELTALALGLFKRKRLPAKTRKIMKALEAMEGF